jgi:predicted PurR-regulated permease PerM
MPAFSMPRTLLWILGALAGLWLIYRLWAVWLLLIAALVFAGALHPVVVAAEAHGFKRRKALALVITVLTVGGALLTFFTVPPLIVQFETIVHDLPGQRLRLIAELDQHPLTLPLGRALSAIQLTEQTGRLRALLIGHTTDAAVVVGYALTTLFLSLYFLTDGKRTQGVLYAIVPRTHHMRLARIIYNLRTIVGGYVRGQILTSVAFGALTLLLLEICRVPNALPFALLASVLDVIPTIGGLLAAGPTFLAALSQGPKTALIVLVVMLGYQLFANKVLVPAVYGRALRLSPVTVTLAMIAGGILFGVMGALFALPLAAALQMIPRELGLEMPGDDSDDSVARTRDEKTEAAYELMSSGSTAPDAGQIANELAHGLREADAWVAASEARKKGAPPPPPPGD